MIPMWFSVVMVLIVTIAVFVGMWLERRITKEGTPSTSTNTARAKPCASCRYEGRTGYICKHCCQVCFSDYDEKRTASPVAYIEVRR